MEPTARSSYIKIARIVRARGNRGEVLADLYTDFPSRFDGLAEVWLEFEEGRRIRMVLESSWAHKGRQVLKFAGVDSISAAEGYLGAWIEVPTEEAVPLPDGTYFDHELVGCSVRDSGGRTLGTITEVLRIAGNSQLVVMGEQGEFMIPAVAPICREVSIAGREVIVELPEGLIDLNK